MDDPRPEIPQEPQMRNFGALVSDLRGYTALFEQTSPLLMAELLNHYYQVMIAVVAAHGGVVDKLMGDSILALFDSHDNAFAAQRMAACAIEMQLAMPMVNAHAARLGVDDLHMGIGLCYGPMVVCKLGSPIHRESTVLGEAVNLASRIASYCLRGQVLMDEPTYQLLQRVAIPGSFNAVRIKGKSQPVTLCELLGLTHPRRKLLPISDIRRGLRVNVDLPVTYYPVVDKQVSLEGIPGRIVKLSEQGLGVLSTRREDFLQEMQLLPEFTEHETARDIYAKVLSCKPEADGQYLLNLEFTFVGGRAGEAIRSVVEKKPEE
jgi:adenylate cyclase